MRQTGVFYTVTNNRNRATVFQSPVVRFNKVTRRGSKVERVSKVERYAQVARMVSSRMDNQTVSVFCDTCGTYKRTTVRQVASHVMNTWNRHYSTNSQVARHVDDACFNPCCDTAFVW